MREHLMSLVFCVGAALVAFGCRETPQEPEPIPANAPIALNQFVRTWARTPELSPGDSIKELHARENHVFAYTKQGRILCMARESGDMKWVVQIRKNERAGIRPPVVLKEHVVIPTSGTLEVYEPTEGTFLRSVPLKVAARSNAVGTGTMVFLGGDSATASRFVALDVVRPYVQTVWQLMIVKGGLKSTPAVFEDTVYIGGGDGRVYAVAAANRESLWQNFSDGGFETDGPITGDIAVDETGVYVASTDTRMYCLNRGNGHLMWQYYSRKPLPNGPILTTDLVYLPVPDVGMAAFSKEDPEPGAPPEQAYNRTPMWVAPGMTQFLATDDKFVYMRRGSDNSICALDKQTGDIVFQNHRRDLVVFATNSKPDGTIFASSRTHRVIAIKPVLRPGVVGELVWNETDLTDTSAAVAMTR